MGKLSGSSITIFVAVLAAGCGNGAVAPVVPTASSGAVKHTAPAGNGAVVSGAFKSGRMQLTLTGVSSAQVDLPNLAGAAGAPGSTGGGPGYVWYAEGDTGASVKIRFPGDPVRSGTTASLPYGTGIQIEFDLIASNGDLFSSSNGECAVAFSQNDASGLRGRLDCQGVPGSSDPAKTINAAGTFEAQP